MVQHTEIRGTSPAFVLWLSCLGVVMFAGLRAAMYMEHEGHYVTGMTNQVVWGIPHVFAVFLILSASGALNAASMASVFERESYKPIARISALASIALLTGGLCVLVLDLGRPDRLLIAMTHYNFKSIFAWNIFLYSGFLLLLAIYLWVMMERRFNHLARPIGIVAFGWRIVLTTGTGSIFGFLVARQSYDSALIAPLFIAVSLSVGFAVFVLILAAAYSWTGRVLEASSVASMIRLQGLFLAAVLYFVVLYHLANLYVAEYSEIEKFILFGGGIYTAVFWIGQIILGTVLPFVLFYLPKAFWPARRLLAGSVLVVLGTLSQLYVLIVGGQAFPQNIFPGFDVLESSFFDGVVASYVPSVPEVLLGLGGIALALAILTIGLKVLPFLPESTGAAQSVHGGL